MWRKQLLSVLHERKAKKIFIILSANILYYGILLLWCSITQSMALLAYTYTMGFNIFSLMTCVLTIWVKKQKPSSLYTFGYERFEVLAVFASTILAQLASVFIIKESIERLIIEQPEIHTGRLLVGAGLTFVFHIIVIYGVSNVALEHVIAASASSWLQEHVSDISQSVCTLIPALSSLLLPRINPMLLTASTGAMLLFFTDFLIEMRNYHMADTFAAILIAIMMCATMLPMSVYTGKVLLQTTPSHVIGQLDKCLRESLTIDGVLEFRNEHFWTLSFGKMAGSLHVRVSRDADEQLVLAHVVDKLSNVVSELTVQVFKDEWALRRGVNSIAPLMSMSNNLTQSFQRNDITYNQSNNASNGKSVSISPGNWAGTVPHAHPDKSYSENTSVARGVTSQTGNSPIRTGRSKDWNSMHNTNVTSSNPTVEISEKHSHFTMKPFNLVNHSAAAPMNSAFQNFGRMNVPSGNQPIGTKSANSSPQRVNPFLQEIPLPSATNPPNLRNNNLLLSGFNMLDSDKFVYRPR